MNEIRKYTEIGKMLVKLRENFPDKSILLDDIHMPIYDEVKELYFRDMLKLTEDQLISVDVTLSESILKFVTEQADKEGIPRDELISNMLTEYPVVTKAAESKENYDYLPLGEFLRKDDKYLFGDIYIELGSKSAGYKYVNPDVRVIRKREMIK